MSAAWRGLALVVLLFCGTAVGLGPRILQVTEALNAWSGGTPGGRGVCSFRARTGLPCVGCGGTHAFALGMRGAFPAALRANPLGAYAAAAAWVLGLGAAGTLLSGRPGALRAPLITTIVLFPAVLMATVVWWWWRLPPGALFGR